MAVTRIPLPSGAVSTATIKVAIQYIIPYIVGTNCSIITRNSTGSSLTPTYPGSCLVLQVSITKVQIIYHGMPTFSGGVASVLATAIYVTMVIPILYDNSYSPNDSNLK